METAFGILIAIVAFTAFPWMGWQSLKRLRDEPEFPHREEMLWGAKYGGWIASLSLWGPYYGISVWYHITGNWPFTAMGIGFLLVCVFGLIAMSVLYWQMAGTFYHVTVGVRRLKQRSTDRESVLEQLQEQIDSRGAMVLRWLLWLGVVFWLGFVATFGMPVDRAIEAVEWQNQMENAISAELEDLPVDDVYVSREWGEFTPGYPGIDDWSPVMFPIEGSTFHEGLSEVSLHMDDEARTSEARQAAEVAVKVLSRRELTDEWMITVHHPPAEPLERAWSAKASGR
jgi:hypothetical protein